MDRWTVKIGVGAERLVCVGDRLERGQIVGRSDRGVDLRTPRAGVVLSWHPTVGIVVIGGPRV